MDHSTAIASPLNTSTTGIPSAQNRVSHGAFLPVTNQLPHDPRRLPINADVGWRIAHSENIVANHCGYIQLDEKSESARLLTESNGSLGGIILPKHIVYTQSGGLLLLDKDNARLKKFDPCAEAFVTVPCTGGMGCGIREFNQAQALSICGDNVLIADTGNQRLMVYSLLGFLVRGIWLPPEEATEQVWQPTAVVVSQDRKVLVADPANGCIHIFNFAGCWLCCIAGVGAVQSIAIDIHNNLYINAGEGIPIRVYDLAKHEWLKEINDPIDLTPIKQAFCSSPIETDSHNNINLSGICQHYRGDQTNSESLWFNGSGKKIKTPALLSKKALKKYQQQGVLYTELIDSHLYRCQWDRVILKVDVPTGTRVKISTFTAESPLTEKQIRHLADRQWLTQQYLFPGDQYDWDALIRSVPGRLLWLKIEMMGNGINTPTLCGLELQFPRVSLRRYLPAVFGQEQQAADFSDRFLAIFDRGFRQIENRIDTMAALLDPLSAPADAGKSDFLSWLASWIGITLDRQLPLTIRRNLVKYAGKLFQCRGTLVGLRGMLELYLNFSQRFCYTESSAFHQQSSTNDKHCVTCETPFLSSQAHPWQVPRLILEHYKLRRWLFVGAGRLGDQARLWGKNIINRTQLSGPQIDGNAQIGVTQLNLRQDPLRDPFHEYAHKFSVFLPAWVGRLASYKKSVERIINAEKPAHTEHNIIYVEPRFRVGIQSMIGFDSVIACYPHGITLNEAALGKATVLSEPELTDSTICIGSKSTIGSTMRLK